MLTYRQQQYVKVFTYLAKQGQAGAKRAEIGSGVGLKLTPRSLKLLLDEMVTHGYIVSEQVKSEPRMPYRYWAAHMKGNAHVENARATDH